MVDLLVGCSEGHTAASASDPGRVDVYLGNTTLPSSPSLQLNGLVAEEEFSHGLAVGDINGDGYDDVIVGSEDDDVGASNAGVVRLYLGTPNGLGTTANTTWLGTLAGGEFGAHVASGGDVNGDGYDDVLMATPDWTGDFSTEGKVELYYGSGSGVAELPAATWLGGQTNASLGGPSGTISSDGGAGVAFADVNGDGYDDILMAAWLYDAAGGTSNGDTRVVLGSRDGPQPYVKWSGYGAPGSQQGYGLAGADVNGDGYDDLVLGGPQTNFSGSLRVVPGPFGDGINATVHELAYATGTGFSGGNRYRGNIFLVSTAALVTEVQMYLNPAAQETVEWGYYTASSISGTYTLQGSVTNTVSAGPGWKSTGPIEVDVTPGDYVAFIAQWDGTVNYWNRPETLPTTLPGFGTIERGVNQGNAAPLPASTSLTSSQRG